MGPPAAAAAAEARGHGPRRVVGIARIFRPVGGAEHGRRESDASEETWHVWAVRGREESDGRHVARWQRRKPRVGAATWHTQRLVHVANAR